MWSMSSSQIVNQYDEFHLTTRNIDNFNTANFLVYGLTTYVSGVLGDAYNLKVALPISYLLQAVCVIMIGVGGLSTIQAKWYYYLWFILLGLF